MRINIDDTIFCLVDVQEKLYPHVLNSKEVETNLLTLIQGLKRLEVPFVVNEQYKKGLGETVPSIEKLVCDYPHFEKTTFSCCKNEPTMSAIKELNKKNVIVAGIETHVCVLQTCMDLLEAGLQPILVTDCVTSRKQKDTDMAIKRMIQLGVIPTTYESILFELTLNAKNPAFKEISKLVK
ncbi:MAG: hydrolase [Campylobacterota bacterium]